jgi:DNA processing protein
MFEDNPSKRSSYLHSALMYHSGVWPDRDGKNNDRLRDLLLEHGSLEEVFQDETGFVDAELVLGNLTGLRNIERSLAKTGLDFDVTTILDDDYPHSLKEVQGAPPILYSLGDRKLWHEDKIMAIVGTRRLEDLATPEDIAFARRVVQESVSRGYTVASGLAEGCDTFAHRTAIESEGRTIAILGNHLDTVFPKENSGLQQDIAESHLLVSEYPIGIRIRGPHYAIRNKTTVGLSTWGVTVILTEDKGGTQHAIRECDDQGKNLCVLDVNERYNWFNQRRGKMGERFHVARRKNGS